MAVYRSPHICPMCGEQIKEIHSSKGRSFIGDTFVGYESHVCKPENIKFHFESIVCPECNVEQLAKVDHSIPFYTYIHECIKCGHTIMESEWQKAEPISFKPK